MKRQFLSTEVTPESTKQLVSDHHEYPRIWVKSYSVCGEDNADGIGAVQSSQKSGNNLLFKSQIEPVTVVLGHPGPKIPGNRANGNMLSQSMHHSPARPADQTPNEPGDKTGAGTKKNVASVKEDFTKYSYRRLVGHLERKYQDIKNIFRTETRPRAQARLASPSPSPSKPN